MEIEEELEGRQGEGGNRGGKGEQAFPVKSVKGICIAACFD